MNRLTAIVHRGEQEEVGFCATCFEVPGANGQGERKGECHNNLANAVKLLLENFVSLSRMYWVHEPDRHIRTGSRLESRRYSRLEICATRERFMESLLSVRTCIGTMNRIEDENEEEDEKRFTEGEREEAFRLDPQAEAIELRLA
jgi:predicted RNase H-like HicB family nuclease